MRPRRAILILIALLLVGCGGSDEGAPGPDPSASPSPQPGADAGPWALDLARGAERYGELCQSCHQRNGSGGYGPALDNTATCPPCAAFESLWKRIDEAMPLRNPQACDAACSRNIAAWILNDFSTAPTCSVEFRYDGIAADRYRAKLRIVNFRGETVPGWRLGFEFGDDQHLSGGEGLRIEQDGSAVLIEPLAGNTTIANGATREFALDGRHGGSPRAPSELRLEAPPCFTAVGPGP